jgi:hypothetical protein
MWESPKYRFRIPLDPDDDGHGELKEIAIDVTGSAPSFESPRRRLGGVFEKLFAEYGAKRALKILDLGAGKLRNTVHILQTQKHSHIWAVEYESLRASSDQAQAFYKKARSFTRFHDMSFPHQFIKSNDRFDLVLLVNVISVMPIPAERFLMLQFCLEKLKPEGRLFWYSQHREPDYAIGGARCNDQTRCGDGFFIGGNKYEKTFFREFDIDEVDEMMLAAGLSFEKAYAVDRNLARVYVKRPPAALTALIDKAKIDDLLLKGASIAPPQAAEPLIVKRKAGLPEILPDQPALFDYDLFCAKRLGQIEAGRLGATAFHRVAELILRRAFRGALDGWETEKEVDDGRGRIDLFAKNRAERGFFDRVRDHFGIKCPYVSIECKNYSGDVGNTEMNQLSSRLNSKRGQLGVLVCRTIKNRKNCLDHARDHVKKDEYIIVLTDSDLQRFCEASRENDRDAIDNLMEDRLQDLL